MTINVSIALTHVETDPSTSPNFITEHHQVAY